MNEATMFRAWPLCVADALPAHRERDPSLATSRHSLYVLSPLPRVSTISIVLLYDIRMNYNHN